MDMLLQNLIYFVILTFTQIKINVTDNVIFFEFYFYTYNFNIVQNKFKIKIECKVNLLDHMTLYYGESKLYHK